MSSIVVACALLLRPGPLNEPGLSPYGVFATRPTETQAMTPCQLNPDTDSRPDAFRRSRADTAQALHDFGDSQPPHPSRRQFAQHAGIPHATLDYWLRRQQQHHDRHPDEPHVAAFLHSVAGERFLRRLVLAAHATFHQAGTCGIRDICRFLRHADLRRPASPRRRTADGGHRLRPGRTTTSGRRHGPQEDRRLPG